jgi:hypothetical protein
MMILGKDADVGGAPQRRGNGMDDQPPYGQWPDPGRRGLRRIGWSGAVAAGVISLVAARSAPGRTITPTTGSSPAVAGSSGSTSSGTQPATTGSSGLQPATQPPVTTYQRPVVRSGGS